MSTHSPRPRHRLVRVLAAGAVVLTTTLGSTLTAQAHVRVRADSTTAGSFSALTFRVPNESDTAGTVKVSVELPQDTPFLYVSTRPVPGWTASTTEAKLDKPVKSYGTTITTAVRTVTWTADRGTQIRPGEYQEFSISAGPLPAAGTILLPATQTYSDGEVVVWDEPTTSGAEPEHPAPELVVTAAAASASPAADPPTSAPAAVPATLTGRTDGLGRGLGAAALVVAVAALAIALLGRRRAGAGT